MQPIEKGPEVKDGERFWERILQHEGMGEELPTIEAEGLMEHEEDAEVLYLGLPAGSGAEGSGIELVDELAAAEMHTALGEGDEVGEDPSPVGQHCPVLLGEDMELVEEIKARHHAVSLSELFGEIGAYPLNVVRLIEAGWAIGEARRRGDVEHPIFALTSATDDDVKKAANRAEADLIGESFERMVSECARIAGRILSRLHSLGGACSEREALESVVLEGFGRCAVAAVARELVECGNLRRVASRPVGQHPGCVFLALPGATREQLKAASRRMKRVEAASEANRRMGGKRFLKEAPSYSRSDDEPTDPLAAVRAAQEFRAAARKAGAFDKPALRPAELARQVLSRLRERGPESWRNLAASHEDPSITERILSRREVKGLVKRLDSRKEGTVWAATLRAEPTPGGTVPERIRRILAWREWRAQAVAQISRQTDPERVALDTARAIALAGGSGKARALLALTASEGPVALDELGGGYEVLKELGAAGLVRAVRRRSDGAELAAITERGERATARALLRIVADPANRIPVPAQDRPARKVAAA